MKTKRTTKTPAERMEAKFSRIRDDLAISFTAGVLIACRACQRALAQAPPMDAKEALKIIRTIGRFLPEAEIRGLISAFIEREAKQK